MNKKASVWLALVALLIVAGAVALGVGPANAPPKEGRRVVLVTNIVQKGAQPIHGAVIKVEVIDAVDIKGTHWQLKVAVRIRNARGGAGDRVRCDLAMSFDGKPMDYSSCPIDIPATQSDLAIFRITAGDGKAASQLSKLTAEARNIRIGD
jgi:hypothetical protein